MPLANQTRDMSVFCRQVEGSQQFGDFSEQALQGLRLWRDVWGPTLRKALQSIGSLDLRPIITKALQMGDELHNRHSASSSLFANTMAVAMAHGVKVRDDAVEHVLQVAENTCENRSSMGQDVDNKRQTEIEAINGAVVREGERLGIETPVNRTLTALVQTLQAHY